VAVAVGMFEGATWGAVFSLIMGIIADMAFIENTITFTVLFPALSFAAGFVSQFFINRRFFAFMGATVIALLITGVVQMLKTSAMDVWSGSMITTILIQTLWSLPPSVLAYFPPAKWIN
jgi:cell shape-determining protein MreD